MSGVCIAKTLIVRNNSGRCGIINHVTSDLSTNLPEN